MLELMILNIHMFMKITRIKVILFIILVVNYSAKTNLLKDSDKLSLSIKNVAKLINKENKKELFKNFISSLNNVNICKINDYSLKCS